MTDKVNLIDIIPNCAKLKLIYRGSVSNFSAQEFHKKCDKIKPTITLVKSNKNDKIFGGFTDLDWEV